jgi:hypothetical protein
MLSTRHSLEVAKYPDSGQMLVMRRPDETVSAEPRHTFRPGQSLDHFDGEL